MWLVLANATIAHESQTKFKMLDLFRLPLLLSWKFWDFPAISLQKDQKHVAYSVPSPNQQPTSILKQSCMADQQLTQSLESGQGQKNQLSKVNPNEPT